MMVTKRTGRPRGRPKLQILDDPGLLLQIALIEAAMMVFGLDFEQAARLALAEEGKPISAQGARFRPAVARRIQKRIKAGGVLVPESFERIDRKQDMDSRIDTLRRNWKLAAEDEVAMACIRNMRVMMVAALSGPNISN